MPPILPEAEKLLLKQIAQGNEEAFAELFHAYKDKLYAFIYRISHSKETAEDALQDVFLKIWMARSQLVEVGNFSAFLFQIAKNHAINQLRRMTKETIILMEKKRNNQINTPAPDQQLIYKNVCQALNDIVKNLPPQQKAVYRLSKEDHLKHDEIAKQLAISPSTVKNHMTQALRTIRSNLEKHYANLLILGTFSFIGIVG